jgi:serine-type D-Ala-D-Ala carboxypeptidase/endopeptidase
MVVQKKVSLNEPIRALLPPGFAGRPSAHEITLLDLATHHSGLPRMPDNFEPAKPSNPSADYDARHLAEFLAKHSLAKPDQPKFLYSNLGFGLLGYALSQRAGISYAELVQTEITGPLQMRDTVVTMSSAQRKRLIQGYDGSFHRADPWDFNVFAGAGALKSTASNMLTYLDANLHPEKYAAHAAPGSPAKTLPAAVALDHQPRADTEDGGKIALAWGINPKTYFLNHSGGTGGYGAFARFDPRQDWAMIVLYNRDSDDPRLVDRVAENTSALLSGERAIPLDSMCDAEKRSLARLEFPPTTAPPKQHREIAVNPKLFDGYVGRYQLALNFIFSITREGSHLFVQASGQQKFELFPESDRDYFLKVVDAQISFEVDRQGRASGLILHQNGLDQYASRIK